MADTITGHCLCGETSVTLAPAKREMHACHCGMCRRWTGSAFMGIEAAPGGVTHRGPVRTRRSSGWAERAWCDSCGSTLWYRVTAPGPYAGSVSAAAGLFAEAADYPLTEELCIEQKPSGYAFAGERATHTEAELMAMFAPDGGKTP